MLWVTSADSQPSTKHGLRLWLASQPVHNVALGVLFLVGWTWIVVRFCGLDVTPPGFFMDEATPAVHAMCLAETGKNMDGQSWPLYSHAAGGGQHPLTLLVFEIAWVKIFGVSRAAFRAVSAFWILLTSLGLFLLAREIGALIPDHPDDGFGARATRAFPWLVLLAALLSPWSFQFSRVAWEAPLAPGLLVFALVAFMHVYRCRSYWVVWATVGGLCAGAAMITYPPLRATTPLVFLSLTLLLFLHGRVPGSRANLAKVAGVTAAVAAAFMAHTAGLLWQGKINQRMNNIAIWRPDWVKDHAGITPHWLFYIETFFDNVFAYLRPSFLLFTGDASMRHSPRISGELSAVDIVAIALVLAVLARTGARFLRGGSLAVQADGSLPAFRWFVVVALCALLGGFWGVLPAALTFDALPHALRAIAVWPFISLFTGSVLAVACARYRWLTPGIALVAVLYSGYFLPSYFYAYDKAEKHWFMREMTDVIEQQAHGRTPKAVTAIVSEHMAYSYQYDEVPLYYLMSEANMSCDEAKATVHAFREKDRQQGK
jgi:hypothetical protein